MPHALESIFVGDSEMARLMREHDWAATPLGPPQQWPEGLKVALRLLLTSRFEMWLGWGPQVHFFYNDAYRPTLGIKHPRSLGMPTRELWAEIWDDIQGRIESVYEKGEATWDRALQLVLHRAGYPEETYHTFSYSPLYGDTGRVEGLFCAVSEETDRVISERRLATLRDIASGLAAADTRDAVVASACEALGRARRDMPFSVLYLADAEGRAHRACAAGIADDPVLAPAALAAGDGAPWDLARALASPVPFVVSLEGHTDIPTGDWDVPPRHAVVVPIAGGRGEAAIGLLAAALNPLRPLTQDLLEFVGLVAGQIGSSLVNADTYERQIAERDRLHAQLEQRIEERTRDLAQALGQLREESKQRETVEEALRHAQKMEAVGQLTGGIAHDFNNILQGITGSLELIQLKLGMGKTDGLDALISRAMGSAQRAASMTHRLLAFSRRQPLDPKPVDVNELVGQIEVLLRRTMGEGVTVRVVARPGVWTTLCDASQLESAILNLCINARDAMPGGGALTVETENAQLDEAYARHNDVQPGDYVCLSVTDTGMGMTPDVLAKAFDPFYTTKPIGQGTGLGLSMIYGFVKQSRGHIRLYSEPGAGTSVRMYLPRHGGQADAPEAAPSIGEAHRSRGEVLLVAEDDEVVRELVVDVLGGLGYRILQAADGAQALRILESGERIDLLVTDVGMPVLNGRQVYEAGLARHPGLKVLFMTGYAENAAFTNGVLEPGMELITKPFPMEQLATRITAMLGG